MSVLVISLGAVLAVFLYLYRLHRGIVTVPKEALEASPHRWTDEEVDATWERIERQPIDYTKHLPPKQERRYVVVGGSGLVGGFIVTQLLLRGQAPESIRIVDFASPSEDAQVAGSSRVGFIKTDITDPASVEAAFSQPWPTRSLGRQPLTVFHTAAVIRAGERHPLFYDRVSRVNIDGGRNVLKAAQAAGADIFIATSSSSVGLVPTNFWIAPWKSRPDNYVQWQDERDFNKPLRPPSQFFSNYSHTKAVLERDVCAANREGFRTGTIRPGNGIYGNNKTDVFVGYVLRMADFMTWTPGTIQNLVSGRNVALAHLNLEAALLPENPMPKCAGRPYVVTDPGMALPYMDFYNTIARKAKTPFRIRIVPPVPMLILAHLIEAYTIALVKLPFLARLGCKEPVPPISLLQPSVFTPSAFMLCIDDQARKSVADGGIGYTGVENTMEGVCHQIIEWNREVESRGAGAVLKQKDDQSLTGKLESAGLVPKPVRV